MERTGSILKTYIDSLDRMFIPVDSTGKLSSDQYGIRATGKEGGKEKESRMTVSLSGCAGTGKSILSLHFASAFLAENPNSLVLYISTDLSYAVAESQFSAFGLKHPKKLLPPYVSHGDRESTLTLQPCSWKDLRHGGLLGKIITPEAIFSFEDEASKSVTTSDDEQGGDQNLWFVDMQSSATGDDWGYLEEFFGSALPIIKKHKEHILIVVDAVEGLDTLVERGHAPTRHDRRQRLARFLETTSKYANVVFTLEVANNEQMAEEEFVADVAIHLRRQPMSDNPRITLEIPKARGMFAYQQLHEIQIRGDRGSWTDEQMNADDQQTARNSVLLIPNLAVAEQVLEHEEHPNARFSVWETNGPIPRESAPALKFNIKMLDNMLGDGDGLPPGVHALIGEGDTFKSRALSSFLAHGLYTPFEGIYLLYQNGFEKHHSQYDDPNSMFAKAIWNRSVSIPPLRQALFGKGVTSPPKSVYGTAVLFISGQKVTAGDFFKCLPDSWYEAVDDKNILKRPVDRTNDDKDSRKGFTDFIINYSESTFQIPLKPDLKASDLTDPHYALDGIRPIFFRRIPSRPVSKEALYYTISENIKWAIIHQLRADTVSRLNLPSPALQIMFADREKVKSGTDEMAILARLEEFTDKFCEYFPRVQYPEAWKVRVAFDDISAIMSVVEDENDRTELLKYVIDLCRRTGVTAIFSDTQPGGPLEVAKSPTGQLFRSRMDTAIYTWHVPYGSGSKVAIAVVPPVNEQRQVVVRELKRIPNSQALTVDRCLELYLDVIANRGLQLQELSRVPLRVLISSEAVLWGDSALERHSRDILRSSLGISDDLLDSDGSGTISVKALPREELEGYVNYNFHPSEAKTVVAMVDEYWSQESRKTTMNGQLSGKDRFLELDSDMVEGLRNAFDDEIQPFPVSTDENHRRLVPFTWNFGLALLKRNPWQETRSKHFITELPEGAKEAVESVIDRVNADFDAITELESGVYGIGSKSKGHSAKASDSAHQSIYWHDFLAACEFVSHQYSTREKLQNFEIDVPDPQSLLSFILEVWFSTYVWLRPGKQGKTFDEVINTCLDHFKMTQESDGEFDVEKAAKENPEEYSLEVWDDDKEAYTAYRNSGKGMSLMDTISNGIEYISVLKGDSKPSEEMKNQRDAYEQCGDLTLSLYITLAMLAQVINFTEWEINHETLIFEPRLSKGDAVAGRYWYSSASALMHSRDQNGEPIYDPNNPWLPVRLPGCFSTRGDWYLAVLSSSRSRFLGEIAIGELSRPKASMVRMQSGIGLPMLDFWYPNNKFVHKQIRTGLQYPHGGPLASFDYEYVRKIGPLRPKRNKFGGLVLETGKPPFAPIYRSEITHYLQDHSLFLKSLCRLLVSFSSRYQQSPLTWTHFHIVFENIKGKGSLKDILQTNGKTGETTLKRRKSTLDQGDTIMNYGTLKEFMNYLSAIKVISEVKSSRKEPK